MQDVKLTLPLLDDMELTASKTASAMGERIRMSEDQIHEVQLAVVEATINAIEHSQAEDRKVRLHFEVLAAAESEPPRGLQITVSDSGVGIPEDKLPAFLAPAQQEGKSGPVKLRKRRQGFRIIHSFMDEVRISTGCDGTTVVMTKLR